MAPIDPRITLQPLEDETETQVSAPKDAHKRIVAGVAAGGMRDPMVFASLKSL